MKYAIHIYDYESTPCKSITPLNESDAMHGEQKIYQYPHKCSPTNLGSLNVRGWKHIASRVYDNGTLVAEKAFSYDMVDITFTRNPELVKYTVQLEYKPDDVCIVSSYVNEYMMEKITKVHGVLHGPREVYVWDHDLTRRCGKHYATHITYMYVNGVKHGRAIHTLLPSGYLNAIYNYVYGKKHGEYAEYTIVGNLYKKRMYSHGECCEETQYYDNGSLHRKETYNAGLPYIGCLYMMDGKTIYAKTESYSIPYPKLVRTIMYDENGNIEDDDTTIKHDQQRLSKNIEYVYKNCKYNTLLKLLNLELPSCVIKSITMHNPLQNTK